MGRWERLCSIKKARRWEQDTVIMTDLCNSVCYIYLLTGKPVGMSDIYDMAHIHPASIISNANMAGLDIMEVDFGLTTRNFPNFIERHYTPRETTLTRYIEKGLMDD